MNADSRNPPTGADGDESRVWLSALTDGEAQALGPACQHWRDDAKARQTWHAYHLIGDVMRSEELATTPARDAAFLAGVRQRLAQEPVVLAPAPVPVPLAPAVVAAPVLDRRRQPWLLPAAAAAGFALVASVMVVSRLGSGPSTAPVMAAASSAGPAANTPLALRPSLSSPEAMPNAAQTALVSGRDGVVRDVRLEEFLRAHQATRGGTMVVAPGGTLRRVDVQVVPVVGESR
jgi:sigma-E factor negative regulatory protein RseA